MYGEGISKTGELIDIGVQGNLVEKSGAWFAYDGQRIGQGRENAKAFMKDNPEVAAKLEAQIRGKSNVVADAMLAGPEADADGIDPESAEVAVLEDAPAPTAKSKKAASSAA
jgi:recombination protein RecA